MKKIHRKSEALTVAESIALAFTEGWNTKDATAFAQPFAVEAQFVTVYGELLQSKAAIAEGHQFILNTIFKNSTVEYSVLDAVLISPGTILAHIIGNGVVAGGQGQAIMTLVIIKNSTGWQVRALQNTLISSVPKK